MYIIPRLTPDTLPDTATAAAWRTEGVSLVHLMLETLDAAEDSLAALRAAGFAVQVELTDQALAEEAAERLRTTAERLFVPFDLFACPRALLALIARCGTFLGVAVDAEEGAVRIPMSIEPNAMTPLDAVRTLEMACVRSILYRDPAAECLPLGQVAEIAVKSGVNLYAGGHLDSLDDLASLDQMKLMGWLCPSPLVSDALRALREGRGHA